jgi:predicted NUDIX family NTP pyrophosphohydrolase
MPRKSAGILLYRTKGGSLEVFLVHPGGPLWAHKDEGAWSIPKGEFGEGEDALEAAKREFEEETGFKIETELEALEPVRQPSGKVIYAWFGKGELDAAEIRSNSFSMEWPPGSRKMQEFAEVDRGAWFTLAEARKKILKGQLTILEELQRRLRRAKHGR